jgi:NCS1 family nucleobase:cation symporter-1
VLHATSPRRNSWLIRLSLIIVTLGINISANSISAANDLVAICPKYINIKRGQLLAAFIGSWAFVPWKILASAGKFLSFLGGYTIFLGPMTSILICEYVGHSAAGSHPLTQSSYYIVRRGKVSVPDMYNFHGIYRYNKYATNWRSVAALVLGFAPPLPGFIQNIQTTIPVSMGGQHL